jgi:hypothetical protein
VKFAKLPDNIQVSDILIMGSVAGVERWTSDDGKRKYARDSVTVHHDLRGLPVFILSQILLSYHQASIAIPGHWSSKKLANIH